MVGWGLMRPCLCEGGFLGGLVDFMGFGVEGG